ncbi:MAG: peptide-methionine (S)-S-oxide reductase MsrA [bacterium]|nr:peptide-methionine (S)-S-oxide reductase MsrA [bacterium]
MEEIILGGGRFWCTEAIFQKLKGVNTVTPGYSGGIVVNPPYEQVSSGETKHAEVIKVEYDPEIITLEQILSVFFTTHDPTTQNRQGADVGTEYRSIILFKTNKQKETAIRYIENLEKSGVYKKIVTSVEPFKDFFKAEDYHINFYKTNPDYGYCKFVIDPKIKKLRDNYNQLLKD